MEDNVCCQACKHHEYVRFSTMNHVCMKRTVYQPYFHPIYGNCEKKIEADCRKENADCHCSDFEPIPPVPVNPTLWQKLKTLLLRLDYRHAFNRNRF